MKTNKSTRPSFSHNTLYIDLPKSWNEVSEKAKRFYLLLLLKKNLTETQLLTMVFVYIVGARILKSGERITAFVPTGRFSGKVVTWETWEVEYFQKQLRFLIDKPEEYIPIPKIKGYDRVDILFRSVPFREYLIMENLFQGFLRTRNFSTLERMVPHLYKIPDGKNLKFSPDELYNCFVWWYSIKQNYEKTFCYFFRKVSNGEANIDMADVMNSQIRALTGGDVTKEEEVLQLDTYRALVELNEKAREINELKKRK